ncbi:hypothetical protein HJ590_12040 [Naumannella sp. ID2617S]|nr:hypothetical protein [Naumannella sp. ID2617S]
MTDPVIPRVCVKCGAPTTEPGPPPHGQLGGLCTRPDCGYDYLTDLPDLPDKPAYRLAAVRGEGVLS